MNFQEMIDSIVVQPDGVEHSRRRFDDARWTITSARRGSHRFGNNCSQTRKVDKPLTLFGVSEGTGRDKNGVAKLQSPDARGQIHSLCTLMRSASVLSRPFFRWHWRLSASVHG